MSKRHAILPILLVFLFTVALSLGLTANNTSNVENNTTDVEISASLLNKTAPADETVLTEETILGNNTTSADAKENSSVLDLKYIWSVTGIEPGPIIMVLDQDGEDLFGQAKYEPDSGENWNGEVVGSIDLDKVDLTLTAQKDKQMVTTRMSGIFSDENINGNFSQVSGGKLVGKGPFSATYFSNLTSDYTPAAIKQPKTEPAAAQTASATQTAAVPNSVKITSTAFQPNSMTVQAGTTVTWINQDATDQAIASENGEFDSGNILPGGQYEYTFSQAGTFAYYSTINSSMTGRIIVKKVYHNVVEDADKILTGVGDISGVPIGMGGSGL